MTDRQTAIVTDSSASLPPEVIEREGIVTVPICYVFDGRTYRDGDLSPQEFYERLQSSREPPKTTSPSPGEFIEAFRRASESGARAVLCLTMSSQLSGTFRAAQAAAEMAQEKIPDLTVRAVDTGGLAMTHGFAVLEAAEALREGASIDEAAERARDVGSQAELVGAMDTMRYLARGGRVPRIVHWAAAALRIKPVLAWKDGEVHAVARVRTMNRALDRLVEYVAERSGERCVRIAVMHAAAPERAEELARRVRDRWPEVQPMITEFTSGMGVHTGPGFAGLAFHAKGC